MNKATLVIDMPSCCNECFALDDNGDYPYCIITGEVRGYTFRAREQKMDKCPLKEFPRKKFIYLNFDDEINSSYKKGWNDCIDEMLR